MNRIIVLKAGADMLMQYLSLHVLTCLVPAFFIAGAIVTALPSIGIARAICAVLMSIVIG